MLGHAKSHALSLNLEFDLDISDVVIPSHCPLLGIPLNSAAPSQAPEIPSLDRIDNTRGYTKENVWVISWRANVLKRDASFEELQLIAGNWKKRRESA